MLHQAATGRSTAEWNADETLTVVVEMSLSSWLIAGLLPGVERRPLKKLAPDEGALMALIERWRQEAVKAGRTITRVVGLMSPGAMASGWRAGCGRAASRRM